MERFGIVEVEKVKHPTIKPVKCIKIDNTHILHAIICIETVFLNKNIRRTNLGA